MNNKVIFEIQYLGSFTIYTRFWWHIDSYFVGRMQFGHFWICSITNDNGGNRSRSIFGAGRWR